MVKVTDYAIIQRDENNEAKVEDTSVSEEQ